MKGELQNFGSEEILVIIIQIMNPPQRIINHIISFKLSVVLELEASRDAYDTRENIYPQNNIIEPRIKISHWQ